MTVGKINVILTMGGASDGAISIGAEAGTEISGSIESACATAVLSGAQSMLEQGNAYGNNQYNIEQQDSVPHLALACVAVIWLSDLESISIGDGAGGLEV